MNTTMWILAAIIILNYLVNVIEKIVKNNRINNTFPYQKTNVLTPTEINFYNALKICVQTNQSIWVKVGLKDIIKSTHKNNAFFNKISQKHIDFIICNEEFKPVYAIELDDKSHNRKQAKKNDEFKNNALEAAGIKLIRIPVKSNYNTIELREHILKG